MMSETQANRLSRLSLRFLLLAISCVVASSVGVYAAEANASYEMTILSYMGGLISGGSLGLASLITGVASARQRKHVLFWTVPLWLGAGYSLTIGLSLFLLSVDAKMPFIPSWLRDGIAITWFGLFILLSLASWLAAGVYRKRIMYFPWWSVPLWTTALCRLAIWFDLCL